jgi:hypothetical protein
MTYHPHASGVSPPPALFQAWQEKSVSIRMPWRVFGHLCHQTEQGSLPAYVETIQDLIPYIGAAVGLLGCPIQGSSSLEENQSQV